VGRLTLTQSDDEDQWLASVESAGQGKVSDRVLAEGQVVLCEVARISTQQAFVQILAVEGKKGTLEEWQRPEGAIRKEDIRTGASELVLVQESFLPGDLVLARILSLGDTRRFILGTAEPQLGVLRAMSASSGRPMIPISWKEMECPETGAKEPRKCAKPRKLQNGA
jgi:exosome complex component CSL4